MPIGISRRFSELGDAEKRRAEAIFAAILPMETVGRERFDAIDREAFWRAIEESTAPSFGPGLRAMVAAVTYLPLVDRRFRKPFHALDERARIEFVEALDEDPRYVVRQIVTSLKMLACLAYFDDPRVRAHHPQRMR